MKKFVVKEYTFLSEKISKTEEPPKFLMISDLHNVTFGNKNGRLWETIDSIGPDGILIAGDLLVGKPGASIQAASEFIREAVKRCPVYYAPGNHEQRIKSHTDIYPQMYEDYERVLLNCGLNLMENEKAEITVRGSKFTVYGLAIAEEYYCKRQQRELFVNTLSDSLGDPCEDTYTILLAHNPKYAVTYLKWGADLTLSGHYHGGMIRLPFTNGLVDPSFTFFPKYCHGVFKYQDKRMLVGSGLGEHTIPIRINNPRELILLHFQYGSIPIVKNLPV